MRTPREPMRRDALKTFLAAAAAGLAGEGLARGEDEKPYGPFQMGIQSYSLRHFMLNDALKKTKELGLGYWESFNAHVPASASPTTIARLVGRFGVKIVGYGVVHFGKDEKANRELFEFGKRLGLDYFSADPDPDAFDGLDKLVAEYGIAVGIHNHGPGNRYAKIDVIAKAIKDHHDKIGCCIDTGHFLRLSEDPVRAVEVFDKRIFGVHLKDVKDAKTFTVLGKGDLRLADLLAQLAKRNYKHCLALEYEENEAAPMDDIRSCLAAVRESLPKA